LAPEKEEKISCPYWELNDHYPACSLVTIPSTPSQLT